MGMKADDAFLMALGAARKYVEDSLAGAGALKGVPCQIQSIAPITGGNRITFLWKDNSDVDHTDTLDVMNGVDGDTPTITVVPITGGNRITFATDNPTQSETFDVMDGEDGISVVNAEVDSSDHLILTLSDGNTIDAGQIKGTTSIYELDEIGIDTSTLQDGDILKYNATTQKWENEELHIAVNLEDLGNVEITNPENNQVIAYDATLGKWVNKSSGATSTALEDLADVNVDVLLLESGQVLVWDAENECWTNGQGAGTNFCGTWDEWSALPAEEREKYDFLDITGDADLINFGKFVETVTTLPIPTEANLGECKLYVGANAEPLVKGTIYECQEVLPSTTPATYDWVAISNLKVPIATSSTTGIVKPDNTSISVDSAGALSVINKTFTGTMTQWEALTPEEQNTFDTMDIYGDEGELNLGRYISKYSTMPEADDHRSEVIYYIGATTADYHNGYFYKSVPHVEAGVVVYTWTQVNTQPSIGDYEELTSLPAINSVQIKGDKPSSDFGLQDVMQWTALPAATAALIGKVYQYIGPTTASLTHNYFYECRYNSTSTQYEWVNVDVSENTGVINRVAQLETNQGDMSQLTISGVTDIVSALNRLALDKVRSIVYNKPYLVITYMDDSTFTFNVSSILSETNLGELANVLDTNIQNTNLLQFDASISKYKPYDIVGVLSQLLTDAKDYTDTELAKFAQADALVVDAKPTYSSTTGVVVYYQDGVMHTTNHPETRFYYTSSGDSYCTSWIDGVEFTFSVATVDWSEYVNKTTDLVSTYTTEMLDKTKVPTIASLDALYALVVTALGLKVNTADIVDNLNSESATVPLSAKQGKVLKTAIDEKQNIIQYDTMPSPIASLEGEIYQYIGADSTSFVNGRFYKCVEVTPATDPATYQWIEVKFSADYDATIIQNSTNAPQGGAVYDGLALKQDKSLSSPLVVDGDSALTVETGLTTLNTNKNRKFQFSTMPTASANLAGVVVQFIGADAYGYKQGAFYKCEEGETAGTWQWTLVSGAITMDTQLDIDSHNAIENGAITEAMQALQNGVFVFYPNEASLPSVIDYANDIIVTVGTVGYCVQEKTFHKVTAINSTSKAITWSAYDPSILTTLPSASDIFYDNTDSGLQSVNTQGAIDEIATSLGTASTKNFTTYISPTSDDLTVASSVYSAITQAVRGAYHPAGNKTCAQLTSELLVQANVGNTYKITDDGTTTTLFIEGAGVAIHAGDGAVVVFDDVSHSFKFSLQTGLIDLTPYQLKEDCENFQNIWIGHKADWEALTTAQKIVYDEAHFDDDEAAEVLANYIKVKQIRIEGTAFTRSSTTYGGWYVATISDFYSKCSISSQKTIINVVVNNNAGLTEIPIIVRDSSTSNYKPFSVVGVATPQSTVVQSAGYIEFKVFYIDVDLGSGV